MSLEHALLVIPGSHVWSPRVARFSACLHCSLIPRSHPKKLGKDLVMLANFLVYGESAYCIAGYFHGWKFSWKAGKGLAASSRFSQIKFKFCGVIVFRMTYVNFELGIRRANFSFDKNVSVSSLARGASITSQTQPTPVRIVFRILKTIHAGVGWVWLTKSYPHWGWLGLLC